MYQPPKKTTPAPSNAISAWASNVHPGSPAPCSPAAHRRTGRKPSLTINSHRRRPSIGQRTSAPSTAEYHPDLTAFGYNSLFVQFDKTPTTPLTSDVFGSIPIPQVRAVLPTKKPGGPIGRFRSFSILRSKKSKSNEKPPSSLTTTKSKGKKSTKSKAKAPPSLANELALMQFMGGGTVEDNVNKVMQARSKAAKSATVVEGVYRDEKGGIWYDKDEEMEYVHLLSFDDDKIGDWEDEEATTTTSPGLGGNAIVVKPTSPFTNAYYCPLDVVTIYRTPTTTSEESSVQSNVRLRSRPLLTLPSRSRRRRAAHLANPSSSFIVDLDLEVLEAFLPPRTPKSPHHRPSVVVGPATTQSLGTSRKQKQKNHDHHHLRRRGRRPRPEPLKLTSSQSAHARANSVKVAIDAWELLEEGGGGVKKDGSSPGVFKRAFWERARREFVEDSFRPKLPLPGQAGRGGEVSLRKVYRADVRDVFGLDLKD